MEHLEHLNMEHLNILVVLLLVDYFYQKLFDNLLILENDFVVTDSNLTDKHLTAKIDLRANYSDPDNEIVNHIVKLDLPSNIFPSKNNMVSFEYELLLFNLNTKKINKKNAIIVINLIDAR